MNEDEFCEGCPQAHDCKSAYQMLGSFKGPSVVTRAMVAFLLPIMVFIVTLGVSGHMLRGGFRSENVRTAISAGIAAVVAIICILISKAVGSWKIKRKTL